MLSVFNLFLLYSLILLYGSEEIMPTVSIEELRFAAQQKYDSNYHAKRFASKEINHSSRNW